MWGLILLAGGTGSRMGAGKNKVLLDLAGIPVLCRSAMAFAPFAEICVIVCRPEDRAEIRQMIEAARPGFRAILYSDAGEDRQGSVRSGLNALPAEADRVMIHDGARCLVDADTIRRVMASVEQCGSGVAAVPVVDTVKSVNKAEFVTGTPDRASLRAVQTPQGFRAELIRQAHEAADRAGFRGTDDASLLEFAGMPVQLTQGSRSNIKLTTPEDMQMARSMLEGSFPSLRIGQGYDVHRLVEGRKLILCGVEVPHTLGLLGHSDADVALHALMDAMLGACALGDIGKHFPDTDEQYRGISSMKLLEHVTALLKESRCRVSNCDVTIIAQRPKLLSYIPMMRANVAGVLGLPESRVNIKATTTEKLGFEGEQLGISSQAVCMVEEY